MARERIKNPLDAPDAGDSVAVCLGIDPGSGGGLGWALMMATWTARPELVASGVVKTPVMGMDDRSELWAAVMRVLQANVVTSLADSRYQLSLDVVAYERVMRHSGVHAAHMYGGQVACIQQWCRGQGIPWTPVHVATVKRFLALASAGRKKVVDGVTAARALGYTQVSDHNEADAVGVALAGLEQWRHGKNVYGS